MIASLIHMKFIFIYGRNWESHFMLFFIWKTSCPPIFVYTLSRVSLCSKNHRAILYVNLLSCMGSPPTFSDFPFYYSPLLCYRHPSLLCGPGTYQPLFLPRAFALAIFFSWNVFLPKSCMAPPGHSGLPCSLKIKHVIPSHSLHHSPPNHYFLSVSFYLLYSILFISFTTFMIWNLFW